MHTCTYLSITTPIYMVPNCMLIHKFQTTSAWTDIQIYAMDPGGKTEDMKQETLDILSCLPS